VRDEALRLNIGTRTLWRWIKAGRVPSYKLGRRVLLRPEEIDYALMNFRRASLFE
jgi:excisionase family DNA binding protein